jgi:5'-nucleotidase/UDP-sugar diphosphatase
MAYPMRVPFIPVLICAFGACSPSGPAPAPASTATLTVLYTADVHSHLLGEEVIIGHSDALHGLGTEGQRATVGGVARLATFLSEERTRSESVLYLDAGDLLEGTSLFPAFGGEAEVRVAEALGLDAMAVGNHDLALGADALGALFGKWATFPLLAANLPEERATGLVRSSVQLVRGGVRVAVIGLGRRPDRSPDLGLAAAAIADAMARVRRASDVVILISHLGRDADFSLVPRTTGLDLVIGGHTHDVIDPPLSIEDCDARVAVQVGCTPHRVPIVHPGAYGRFLGRGELVLSRDARDVGDLGSRPPDRPSVVVESRFSTLPINEWVPERADIARLIAPYAAALDAVGVNRSIAFAPETVFRHPPHRGDSALGNLVADTMLAATGADLAVINTTGVRADLLAGLVSEEDWVRVLPFSDDLVALELPGAVLMGAMRGVVTESCKSGDASPFQISGGRVRVVCEAGGFELSVGGRPLALSRSYRIVAPSYLTEAGRWLDLALRGAEPTGVGIRDAVLAQVVAWPSCPEPAANPLPCVVARADGRIAWE